MIPEVTNTALVQELLGDNPPFLLDVRELHERGISCLDDNAHIPLGELPARLRELDSSQDIVIYCRSGARSGHAVAFLREAGFARVRNLVGGINAWATQIDSTMRAY